MEKNQKLYLHQLIHSLSTSEKGYIKKYCSKNGTNMAYLDLFDAIDQQEVYNEKDLKVKFKKEKFVKQFSVAKNYLTRTILKSLRVYHAESTNNIRIHENLLDIELLYNKRLVGLCEKMIKKTRRLIEEAQLYHHASELAFWEFRLSLLSLHDKHTDTTMQDNYTFTQKTTEYNQQLTQYRHLAYQIFAPSLRTGNAQSLEIIALAQQMSLDPLLQAAPPEENAKALARYHNIWSKIHEIKGDTAKVYASSLAFVQTIQDHPKVFEDLLLATVVPAHYNLLAICIILDREETFFEHLDYMQRIPTLYNNNSEVLQSIITSYTTALEFQYYTQNAQFERTRPLLNTAIALLEEGALEQLGLPMLHLELSYSLAYAYFALEDYDTSETWVNHTLEHQKKAFREDIICLTHILHVVNHAQMGNWQYLDYKLRSTYNFILRMKQSKRFEKTTLQFLKRLLNARNGQEKRKLLPVYLEKLEALYEDPTERLMLKNFDVVSWLRSILQKERFIEAAAKRPAYPLTTTST